MNDEQDIRAALLGYEIQLRQINEKMADIRRRLHGQPVAVAGPKKHHHISAEGRERIRQAQIARWKKRKKAA